jgi:hypothetical protein
MSGLLEVELVGKGARVAEGLPPICFPNITLARDEWQRIAYALELFESIARFRDGYVTAAELRACESALTKFRGKLADAGVNW